MPSRLHDERSIAQTAAQLQAAAQSLEVLALTPDITLLRTLREAVGNQQPLVHARTRDEAAAHLMGGRVSVIIIDTLAAPEDTGEFCDRLRAQFPDLVLLVSGGSEEQTQLVKQITAGDIYRFLHKPVSPARARQFVEAAVRRHIRNRCLRADRLRRARNGA
jgi:DNA-binding response OmpR family regulator